MNGCQGYYRLVPLPVGRFGPKVSILGKEKGEMLGSRAFWVRKTLTQLWITLCAIAISHHRR